MSSQPRIEVLTGSDIGQRLTDLAQLRIRVFREFPYLYDGDADYERRYLQTYLETARSIAVLALTGDGQVVGASTGLPLADEEAAFKAPFEAAGKDPERIFYCAESVLLPEYRGEGLYRHFFHEREAHARCLGQDQVVFCAVQRPADHPARPANYRPLDQVWRHFGYEKMPALTTSFRWKDLGESEATTKTMVFYGKHLG